jgi:hypothetical protein
VPEDLLETPEEQEDHRRRTAIQDAKWFPYYRVAKHAAHINDLLSKRQSELRHDAAEEE